MALRCRRQHRVPVADMADLLWSEREGQESCVLGSSANAPGAQGRPRLTGIGINMFLGQQTPGTIKLRKQIDWRSLFTLKMSHMHFLSSPHSPGDPSGVRQKLIAGDAICGLMGLGKPFIGGPLLGTSPKTVGVEYQS